MTERQARVAGGADGSAARSASSTGRRIAFAIIVVAFVTQLVLAVTHRWIGDDGYIALRYARNLAEGVGLRFNPAEDPPVEGYTQLGWVLAAALVERLGLDALTATRTLEIGAGLILLGLVTRRAWLSFGVFGAAAAALFFATSPLVAVWSTGGLGTLPFALAIFIAADAIVGEARPGRTAIAAIACCAVTLLRFDGIGFAVVVVVGAWFAGWVTNRQQLARRALVVAGVVAAAFALQTVWRQWYYDEWVPNTVRAKIALGPLTLLRGWHYALSTWIMVPALALAIVWTAARAWRPSPHEPSDEQARAIIALAVLVGIVGHVVLSSGDFMPMARFFVPAVAFAALAVASFVRSLERRSGPTRAAFAAALALALSIPAFFGWSPIPIEWRQAVYFRWKIGYRPEIVFWRDEAARGAYWANVGRALAMYADPNSSIVRTTIGGVGYYSRLVVYDQFGLTDPRVARQALRRPSDMTMPGHDTFVPIEFFDEFRPTYVRAELYFGATEDSPEYAAFIAGTAHLRDHIEIHPVHRSDGFEDDGFLVLERGVYH